MLPTHKLRLLAQEIYSRSSRVILLSLAVVGFSSGEQLTSYADALARPAGELTALDKYVAAPDTNYSFRLVRSIPGNNQTTFLLEMTSQAWLTTNEVDRPLWKHWLILVRPNDVSTSKSLLYISGSANDGKEPKGADQAMAQIAVTTKSIVTELRMVP